MITPVSARVAVAAVAVASDAGSESLLIMESVAVMFWDADGLPELLPQPVCSNTSAVRHAATEYGFMVGIPI